jgi:thiosulfate/3-mercaptopyruvate sulfurtransferase
VNEFVNLIHVDILHQHIDDPQLVVIDCRFDLGDTTLGRLQYESGHLPGARYADLDRHLSSPITPGSGRHPLPDPQDFARSLGRWGVSPVSQIVAYDASGGAFAARLWWLARWIGHTRVAVLDGGLAAWVDAGGAVTTAVPEPIATRYEPRVDHSMWIATDQLAQQLDDYVLIDAREAPRFRGEVEPIDSVAGHVPGAINLPFKENLTESGHFAPVEQLAERFAPLASGQRQVVAMCGSGVTACHNLLAMHVAGIDQAKLYAGSWSEWIRDASHPVATGPA